MPGKFSEKQVTRSGFALLLLFSLWIFVSKSGVNIAGALLFIWVLYYLTVNGKYAACLTHRHVWILLLPFFIGLCMSFFSPLGLEGPVRFIREYRFWLLILPFTAFVHWLKDFEKLLAALNLSALAAFVYGMIVTWPNLSMSSIPVSFLSLGRQADLNFTLILANIVVIMTYEFQSGSRQNLIKLFLGVNTLLLFYMLLGLRMSAAWMGLFTGLLFFAVFYHRKLLILLFAGIITLSFLMPDSMKKEARSVLDYKNTYSTAVRIQLYRTGFDFLMTKNLFLKGTGVKNAEDAYIRFMDNQPDAYREKNTLAYKNLPGNFHNSFLQMAVESSFLFLFVYLVSILYLCLWMVKRTAYTDDNGRCLIMIALTVTTGFFVSQLFHGGLYDYASLAFYLFFYSGCFAATGYQGGRKALYAETPR